MAFIIFLAMLVVFIIAVSGREEKVPVFSGRAFRLGGSATNKQLQYLQALVSDQNFFRSKPVTFVDWIRIRTKTGVVSVIYASELIQSLKSENETLRMDFGTQKRRQGVGTFRGELYVSDLRSFYFCERAAYYSSHQYPSQNLVDLGRGQSIHETYSNYENRDATKPTTVIAFIRTHEPMATRIDWLPNTPEANLRHPSLLLSGRPDGFIYYSDGTKAVIELKTFAQLPAAPRSADFHQADIYALLVSAVSQVRDESFLLYVEGSTRKLAFHKRKRKLTEYDLVHIIAKIERGSQSIKALRAAKSAAQCDSCGYRSVCGARLI